MLLDSPCVMIDACKSFLMAITSSAHMYIWYVWITGSLDRCTQFSAVPLRDIKKQKAHVSSSLIQPLVSNPSAAIMSATIRHNGAPIMLLSSGAAFTYDVALQVWTKASEARWAEGSDAWEGRQRATVNRCPSGTRSIIASLEANISDLELNNGEHRGNTTIWCNAALTLWHLDPRLHASRLL